MKNNIMKYTILFICIIGIASIGECIIAERIAGGKTTTFLREVISNMTPLIDAVTKNNVDVKREIDNNAKICEDVMVKHHVRIYYYEDKFMVYQPSTDRYYYNKLPSVGVYSYSHNQPYLDFVTEKNELKIKSLKRAE